MDLAQYAQMFVEESKENLQNLNSLLLKLEKDPNEISIIADIFRVAHTLKGMSATMGYNKIANLTHVMEDSLDRIRNSNNDMTMEFSAISQELAASVQSMVKAINEIAQGSASGAQGTQNIAHKNIMIMEKSKQVKTAMDNMKEGVKDLDKLLDKIQA